MIRYFTTETKGPWKVIPDTPEALAQAIKDGAMFVTAWSFEHEPVEGQPEPNRCGDFVLDYDSEDTGTAHQEVMRLTAHLEEAYGVDPYMLRYYASGGKGFHVEVPAQIFGATEGDPHLPLVFKRMAARLAADCDLQTLDLGIYNMRKGRMWRLPNVQRKNGRYKVPLAFAEMTLPTSELMDRTTAPRDLDDDDLPVEPEETDLARLYQQCREHVYADLEKAAQQEPVSDEQRELLKQNLPSCISYILNKRPQEHSFNSLVLQVVSYLRDAGFNEQDSLQVAADFIEKRHSPTYNTVEKRRRHFREMFLYLKGTAGYNFGCCYVLGFGFPRGAFECRQCPCNPERKPTRAEIEDIINACDDPDELTSSVLESVLESGLSESMKHRLLKIIAKKAKCTLKDLKADAKLLLGDDAHDDDKTVLDHAREAVGLIGRENVLTTSQSIWRWREQGIWREVEDREIRQVVHKVVPDPDVSKGYVDSVVDVFKTETYRPEHQFDQVRDSINCQNGELHWTGQQWELRPHSRENYRTTQIPVAYDPDAGASRFLQFLDEVFEGDHDSPQKKTLLLEGIGYTLTPSTAYEAFFLLYGKPAAGKSVLLGVVEAICGKESVCAVQPASLENEFHRAHMHGRLANIVTEIAEGAEIADAQLKAIVSGELTTASHKFKKPFDFRPFCTGWYGSNHMPHCRDFSNALQRRAYIVPFNRTFAPEDRDPLLKQKLLEELPGILAMSLQAYGEVLKRGHFTLPDSCEAARRQWRMESDQVAQFIEDCCSLGAEYSQFLQEIYDDYRQWAEGVGIRRTLNQRNFADRVRSNGPESHRSTGGRRRFEGIRVTNPPEKSNCAYSARK